MQHAIAHSVKKLVIGLLPLATFTSAPTITHAVRNPGACFALKKVKEWILRSLQIRILHSIPIFVVFLGVSGRALHAHPISDWNKIAISIIGSDPGSTPLTATRALAMMHVAQFDAVNAVKGGYSPYLMNVAAPGASADAAAAQAAHRVLTKLFPAATGSLNTSLAKSLDPIPEGPSKATGATLGISMGDAILHLRDGDGFNLAVTYKPQSGPGKWIPTPPDNAAAFQPHWRHISAWTLRSPSQFHPPPPLALTDAGYATDFNEVKLMGRRVSPARTALQTEIASFHDDVHVFTLGHAARDVLSRNTLTLNDSARLFALMYLACADAAIACWEAKYAYNYWRPITAIRGAANDNNPDTESEAAWVPLLDTPSHPEYPSGHSAVIGAGTAVLAGILGDGTAFTTTSSVVPGRPHSFARFSDLTTEVINARVYAGAHFRRSNLNAAAMGRQIGLHALDNYLVSGPRLEGARRAGEFIIHQRTTGPMQQRIETSSDLTNWLPLIDYARIDLSIRIQDNQGEVNSYRFYRAVHTSD